MIVVFTLIADRAGCEAEALAYGDSMASFVGDDSEVLAARWNGDVWLVDITVEEPEA